VRPISAQVWSSFKCWFQSILNIAGFLKRSH
jgi:hypothetical protein